MCSQFNHFDVGMTSNRLPIVLELGTFLVIEVTEAGWEVKMIVYATVLYFLPEDTICYISKGL